MLNDPCDHAWEEFDEYKECFECGERRPLHDAERPDGWQERLVRIETRMVKYQEANALETNRLLTALEQLTDIVGVLELRTRPTPIHSEERQ